MIVVFDSFFSNRVDALRCTIFTKGFPCAVCDPETIKSLLPIGVIVTFTDQIDVVRRMPYDDVPVIAYGSGFVNSALNAVKAETITEVLQGIKNVIRRRFGLNQYNSFLGECAFFYPGVYLTPFQLIVYGTRLDLTENEFYIMRCLILSGDCYRNSRQLMAYCTMGNVKETCIRVHIYGINKKGSGRLPRPLIESKHGHGYRFGYIHSPIRGREDKKPY